MEILCKKCSYYKKDGVLKIMSLCSECERKKYKKEYNKKYHLENRAKVKLDYKICSDCGLEKELISFDRRNQCKDCRKLYS